MSSPRRAARTCRRGRSAILRIQGGTLRRIRRGRTLGPHMTVRTHNGPCPRRKHRRGCSQEGSDRRIHPGHTPGQNSAGRRHRSPDRRPRRRHRQRSRQHNRVPRHGSPYHRHRPLSCRHPPRCIRHDRNRSRRHMGLEARTSPGRRRERGPIRPLVSEERSRHGPVTKRDRSLSPMSSNESSDRASDGGGDFPDVPSQPSEPPVGSKGAWVRRSMTRRSLWV